MHTNHRNISRVLAAAVASTGFAVAPMPTFAASLTCTSSTFTAGSDGSGNIVVNCTSPSTGASCSLTASPTTVPSSGGTVTLTASNCGTVTSVTKSSSQIASSGTTWTDTLGANTGSGSLSFTYTVQGSSGSDSVVVTQSGTGSTPPPPPPPGGAIACSGYATTLVYDLPWTATSIAYTKGFNNNAIVVARFTTPATGAVSGLANFSSIEYQDGKASRTASLSTVPCDLTGTGFGKIAKFKGTQGVSFTYQINGISTGIVLQPSTTYYVNIVNRDSLGNPSCGTATCNMIIQLTKPFGL
jgi:hypothetical protein